MTKVVPLHTTAPAKRPDVSVGARAKVPAKRAVPLPARVAALEAYGSEVLEYSNLFTSKTATGSDARKGAIEDFRRLSETEEFQAVRDLISDLMERPATRAEVAEHMALLIGAYPNARPADPEVYGRLLVDDVLDAQPSLFTLIKACRDLRRSSRFIPSIAEVWGAIKEAKGKSQAILRADRQITSLWMRAIEHEAAWEERMRLLEEEEAAERKRQEAENERWEAVSERLAALGEIRIRIETKESLAEYTDEMIEEVRLKMQRESPATASFYRQRAANRLGGQEEGEFF